MWGVQSVAMECPAHTALFQLIGNHPAGENGKKHRFWLQQKTEKSGQNSPFEALADEMWAQYIQVSSFNIPASTILWDGGH